MGSTLGLSDCFAPPHTHESELTRADWKAIRGEALAACAAPRTVQSRVIANDADRRANTEDT